MRHIDGVASYLDWQRRGDRLAVELTVPVNAVAEVVLPDGTEREVSSGRHRWDG